MDEIVLKAGRYYQRQPLTPESIAQARELLDILAEELRKKELHKKLHKKSGRNHERRRYRLLKG